MVRKRLRRTTGGEWCRDAGRRASRHLATAHRNWPGEREMRSFLMRLRRVLGFSWEPRPGHMGYRAVWLLSARKWLEEFGPTPTPLAYRRSLRPRKAPRGRAARRPGPSAAQLADRLGDFLSDLRISGGAQKVLQRGLVRGRPPAVLDGEQCALAVEA